MGLTPAFAAQLDGLGRPLIVVVHGPFDYRAAVAVQEEIVARMSERQLPPLMLLLEHPLVATLGRGAAAAAAAGAAAPVVRCARGGSVTVHGPGQVVGYPIGDLRRLGRTVTDFVRDLEAAVEVVARRAGAPAHTLPGLTGLWTPRGKLASIGIAVRRGVSWHGFALYHRDQRANFGALSPCALPDVLPDALEHHAPGWSRDDVIARVIDAVVDLCWDGATCDVIERRPHELARAVEVAA